MDFLLIGDSKLKIIMKGEEMEKYSIDAVSSDCTDPLCRRAVWSILDEAKESVGFDPKGDKVLVQFYPLKPSGCEVFVTKLGILSGNSAKIVSKSEKIALLSRERHLYAFDGFENLKLAIKAMLKGSKAVPEGEVYSGQSDKYFLLLKEYSRGDLTPEFPCLLEFGKTLPKSFFPYVFEHTERIADRIYDFDSEE